MLQLDLKKEINVLKVFGLRLLHIVTKYKIQPNYAVYYRPSSVLRLVKAESRTGLKIHKNKGSVYL